MGYTDRTALRLSPSEQQHTCRICTQPRPEGPICQGCYDQAAWLDWSIEELEWAAKSPNVERIIASQWNRQVEKKEKEKTDKYEVPFSVMKWLDVRSRDSAWPTHK